jgi:hypothetical protein
VAVVLADVVERADVRMLEARDVARLALEALAPPGIGGDAGRQDLDRDQTIQARVARLEHLAHAALADEREHFVRSESGSGGQHRNLGRCFTYNRLPGVPPVTAFVPPLPLARAL